MEVNSTPFSFHPAFTTGTYSWKVTCTDKAGNIGESEIRSFTYTDLSSEDIGTINEIQELVEIVDRSISAIDSFSIEQKRISDTMNYRKLLENTKFELLRSNRDLFNIEWRRLNGTEEEAFRN